jgi:hypothetical protein
VHREGEAPEATGAVVRHVKHRGPFLGIGDISARGIAERAEVGERADDEKALGPGEAGEVDAHHLAHGAASAVAADQPARGPLARAGFHFHAVAGLLCANETR